VIFAPTIIPGCMRVRPEPIADSRGLFARTFCEDEFARAGIPFRALQCAATYSEKAFTLRGMHWQAAPSREGKLVRVTRGRIFDVAVDLRPDSPAYLRWVGVELDAEGREALHIPPGCAHGLLTLEAGTEVFYQMSDVHRPDLARGARWNDPRFAIAWPREPEMILPRDAEYPDYAPEGA
jgi:dTDP-4-dehydrorhamnose 3,5-epimerase